VVGGCGTAAGAQGAMLPLALLLFAAAFRRRA
jgi:uncharacterized protein (TIGR03382 family)